MEAKARTRSHRFCGSTTTPKTPKAMAAMMKMVKFDIATLEAAPKE
jgi:hypothetical protein